MRPSPSCLGSGCLRTAGGVYRPARTRCRPEAAAAVGRAGEGGSFPRMLSGLQLVYGAVASPAEPPQLRPARGCSGPPQPARCQDLCARGGLEALILGGRRRDRKGLKVGTRLGSFGQETQPSCEPPATSSGTSYPEGQHGVGL